MSSAFDNATTVLGGAISVTNSTNSLIQGSALDTAKQVVGVVSTVGDAIGPFVPLIAGVAAIIDETIKIYATAQYNKKICNALIDRVEAAKVAVLALERRKKENEQKFRNQTYYNSFVRFSEVLKKIKGFIQSVSQLQGIRRYTKALTIQDKFNGLISEFDAVVRDLNLAIVISNEEQREIDREALEDDLRDMKEYLENIQGGLTTNNQQITTLFEEFTLIKNKVDSKDTNEVQVVRIEPNQLTMPPERSNSDIRNKVQKRVWRGQDVAIKQIELTTEIKENNFDTESKEKSRIELELALLGKLREGKNIIQFHGISQVDGASVMVVEWAEHGNLREVYNRFNIDWGTKIQIATDICRGITFLHAANILHHDIRCENVLLTQNIEPKITNFHLSRNYQDATTDINKKIIEIVHWLAPEKFDKKRYTTQCEIFSYGMLLWELGHGKKPYENMDMQKIQEWVCSGKRENINFGLATGEVNEMQKEYASIIQEAWEGDPYLRPTLQEIFLKLFRIQKKIIKEGRSPGLRPRRSDHSDVDPEDLPPGLDFSEIVIPIMPLEEGIKAHKAQDRKTAWECFKRHADLGNMTAIYWKGYYLWEGYGVEKDRKMAAEFFKKAADDGIPDAQLRYAFCIFSNEGFDKEEFLRYLRMAADNGNPSAQYNLGDVLLFGKLGVSKDEEEGIRYLRLAALKDQPKAKDILMQKRVNWYS